MEKFKLQRIFWYLDVEIYEKKLVFTQNSREPLAMTSVISDINIFQSSIFHGKRCKIVCLIATELKISFVPTKTRLGLFLQDDACI